MFCSIARFQLCNTHKVKTTKTEQHLQLSLSGVLFRETRIVLMYLLLNLSLNFSHMMDELNKAYSNLVNDRLNKVENFLLKIT